MLQALCRRLNEECERLWEEESGVVLLVAMVAFATLFVATCCVYAVGEHVREKIELQNAADAAAYAGALVQADAISRIAAINRAMAWTYGQMVRMEMDYIVDVWLDLTLDRFEEDLGAAQSYNSEGDCNYDNPTHYWAGIDSNQVDMVLLNKHLGVDIDDIEAARSAAAAADPSSSASSLAPRIRACRRQIEAMNAAIDDIIETFPGAIRDTVRDVVRANIADSGNDLASAAGSAGLRFSLLMEEDPASLFAVETGEEEFLSFIDWDSDDLGPGAATETRDGWYELRHESDGIRRGYRRGHKDSLLAEWSWWSSQSEEAGGECEIMHSYGEDDSVAGDDRDIYVQEYYETALARPRKLTRDFFGKKGSIVVGVARRLHSPFAFLCPGGQSSDGGLFSMFSVGDGARFAWAAASARAGYRLPGLPECEAEGAYATTYRHGDGVPHWNVKGGDWDAVLLPLDRAWSSGDNGRWQGAASGGEVLAALRGRSWEPLDASGSSGGLGAQHGPGVLGMGRGDVRYAALSGRVFH